MTNAKKDGVLLISNQEATKIETILASEADFEFIGQLEFSDSLFEELASIKPEIVLLACTPGLEEIEEIIDKITIQFPHTSVIAAIPEDKSKCANQIMLSGARAFLTSPYSSDELISTLARVRELQQRTLEVASRGVIDEEGEEPGQSANTFVVFSPRGGSGCTTLATNLAIGLHKAGRKKVLLVDGKILFGHVDLFLNLKTYNSLINLTTHAGGLDENLINNVVERHTSGIFVLTSPEEISVAQGIRPDDLYHVLLELNKMYSDIIIDAGSNLTENAVTLMDAADKIILIIPPDLPAIKDARRFLGICQSLNYPREKLIFVLNQHDIKSGVKVDEIEKALNTKFFAMIPSDTDSVNISINKGIPILINKSRNKVSRAIKSFVQDLKNSIDQSNAQFEKSKNQEKELISKTSRLG
jgi:pilus assembly protein CpaE